MTAPPYDRPPVLLIAPFRNRTSRDARRLRATKIEVLAAGYFPVFAPDALEGVLFDELRDDREAALECSTSLARLVARDPRGRAVVVSMHSPDGPPRPPHVHRGSGPLFSPGMVLDAAAWNDAAPDRPLLYDARALPELRDPTDRWEDDDDCPGHE